MKKTTKSIKECPLNKREYNIMTSQDYKIENKENKIIRDRRITIDKERFDLVQDLSKKFDISNGEILNYILRYIEDNYTKAVRINLAIAIEKYLKDKEFKANEVELNKNKPTEFYTHFIECDCSDDLCFEISSFINTSKEVIYNYNIQFLPIDYRANIYSAYVTYEMINN